MLIGKLLTGFFVKRIVLVDRGLPADFMQQLIAQMALDESGQMAVVAPVILFDKFQKDNPGGVYSILAQSFPDARIVRFLQNQRREGQAELLDSLCVLLLCSGDDSFQLRRREACVLLFLFCFCDVDYKLSVAALAAYDRILCCTTSGLMRLL